MESSKKKEEQFNEEDLSDLLDECSLEIQKSKEAQAQTVQPTVREELDAGKDVGFEGMPFSEDQQKLMAEMMGKLFGGMGAEEGSSSGQNPLDMATKMFEDLEKITKEQQSAGSQGQNSGQNPMFPGAGGEQDNMFEMLNGFAKDLMSANPDDQNKAFDNIMGEFSEFLKESESNPDMKEAFDSVVNEVLSKDVLQKPMVDLRDKYPAWLKKNEGKIEKDKFENYEKQHQTLKELCVMFDANKSQEEILKQIEKLQSLGDPPEELMKHLVDNEIGSTPPFTSK